MNRKVTFDYSRTSSFISADEMDLMKKLTLDAKELLVSKTGAGSDFLGWLDLPVNYDKEEFDRIKKAAAKIQSDSEVLVVIGIGGSYLGARAATPGNHFRLLFLIQAVPLHLLSALSYKKLLPG